MLVRDCCCDSFTQYIHYISPSQFPHFFAGCDAPSTSRQLMTTTDCNEVRAEDHALALTSTKCRRTEYQPFFLSRARSSSSLISSSYVSFSYFYSNDSTVSIGFSSFIELSSSLQLFGFLLYYSPYRRHRWMVYCPQAMVTTDCHDVVVVRT